MPSSTPMVQLSLLLAPMFSATLGAATTVVEIAPGVNMPLANMGGGDGRYSNYTLWIESGGRGLDTALSYIKGDVQPKLGAAVPTAAPACLAQTVSLSCL